MEVTHSIVRTMRANARCDTDDVQVDRGARPRGPRGRALQLARGDVGRREQEAAAAAAAAAKQNADLRRQIGALEAEVRTLRAGLAAAEQAAARSREAADVLLRRARASSRRRESTGAAPAGRSAGLSRPRPLGRSGGEPPSPSCSSSSEAEDGRLSGANGAGGKDPEPGGPQDEEEEEQPRGGGGPPARVLRRRKEPAPWQLGPRAAGSQTIRIVD